MASGLPSKVSNPKCAFNDQKHVRARNNRFQLYPSLSTIRSRIASKAVHSERFQDLYFKDHIWTAKEVWREKYKHIKMNDFSVLCGLHLEPFVF